MSNVPRKSFVLNPIIDRQSRLRVIKSKQIKRETIHEDDRNATSASDAR